MITYAHNTRQLTKAPTTATQNETLSWATLRNRENIIVTAHGIRWVVDLIRKITLYIIQMSNHYVVHPKLI